MPCADHDHFDAILPADLQRRTGTKFESAILIDTQSANEELQNSMCVLSNELAITVERHNQLQMDDYILGATILYVDIISLFLKILQILGKKKDD